MPKKPQAPIIVGSIDGHFLTLERKPEYTTCEQLLNRFYVHNEHTNPIGCRRVPEKEGGGWWLAYYRSYLVHVDNIANSSFGPHRAKLFYRSDQSDNNIWIATLQLEFFFESQESLFLSVLAAITAKQWYQTPKEQLRPILK